MIKSGRVEAFRCWIPSSNIPGLNHALRQWLDSMGLFAEISDEPSLKPGDPLLLSLLLGPADSWVSQSTAIDHLNLGGAAVIDADALTSAPIAGELDLAELDAVADNEGVVGRVRGHDLQPAAVWRPILWSLNEDNAPVVAVIELEEEREISGVFLTRPDPGAIAILAFPVARIAAWFMGATGDQSAMGTAPMNASPYQLPHVACSSPVLDIYGELLWRALGFLSNARGGLIVRKRPLPVTTGPVLCLSHDVDGLTRNARALANDAIRAFREGGIVRALISALLATSVGTAKLLARFGIVSRHQPCCAVPSTFVRLAHRMGVSTTYLVEFARLLQLERAQRAASTLFFLDNKSSSNSDYSFQDRLFKSAINATTCSENTIGLHGTLQSSGDRSILMSEANELREAVSKTVVSVRQHHLLSSPAIRRNQERAGFKVDSSLGYNYTTAFRAGTSRPFLLFDSEEGCPLDLWEIPLIAMDSALVAEFDGSAGTEKELRRLMKELIASQGVLTLNWHSNFSVDTESSDGCLEVYERLIRDVNTQSSEAFWTIEDLFKWYRKRAEVHLKSATFDGLELVVVLLANESDTRVELEFVGATIGGLVDSPISSHRVSTQLELGDNTIRAEVTKSIPIP